MYKRQTDDSVEELLKQVSADVSTDPPKPNAEKKPRIGGDVKKLGDFGGVAIQDNNELAALMNSERQ